MKQNYWLILGMLAAAGAVAQSNTNLPPSTVLPPIPPPNTAPAAEPVAPAAAPAPAAEPVKKAAPAKPKKAAAPKRAALKEPTVALMPGAAEVAVENLNVRGQAGLKGEAIAHLKKGEVVAVMSQINLDKHQVGEPAQWAKIALPASTHVWIHTSFIDSATKTVVPKKLNLRAGPGENFSVLGVIEHGTAVKEITTKGVWTEIAPPESACGFVAAMYLKQVASGSLAANTPASTETEPAPLAMAAPTPTPVPEAEPIVTAPANPAPVAAAPEMVDPNAASIVDTNPPPPRVVTHEGVVKHVDSVIAPTSYVLYDPATGKEINYLHSKAASLDVSRYAGMRIIVTGEEGLQKRWKDTPVLTIQRIVVLDTNALNIPDQRLDYRIPRQIN
ncbi:MAG TPA: hypothetical protein VNN22_13365 [Verrucomicrobiae bacterium]|nr:hypothetical protein [Verrucomicrobiae bacterium]